MKAADVYKWQKARRKGILRYVLKCGPLIALALVINSLSWKAIAHPLTTTEVIGDCLVALYGGFLIAPLFWLSHEHQYKRWYDKEFNQ